MLLAVRISSYGCTWEVWRALNSLVTISTAIRMKNNKTLALIFVQFSTLIVIIISTCVVFLY